MKADNNLKDYIATMNSNVEYGFERERSVNKGSLMGAFVQ